MAGSMMSPSSIRWISTAATSLAVGPAQYGALCIGLKSLEFSSIQYLGIVIRPGWPCHMFSNFCNILKNSGRFFSYRSALGTFSCQSLFRWSL